MHSSSPRESSRAATPASNRLVQRDFVRAGKLDPDIGGDLSRLQSARQSADYAAEHVFTDKAARESLEMARRFAAAVRDYLVRTGWLDSP